MTKLYPKKEPQKSLHNHFCGMKMANAFWQEHEDIYKKNKATEWKIQQ